MSLFPVLTDLDAAWFLVVLKEPRDGTVREVLCHIRDEHLYGRRPCPEGRVPTGPSRVSEEIRQGNGVGRNTRG